MSRNNPAPLLVRTVLPLLATALLLTACDFYPVVFDIHVETEDGYNRLDPESEYFIGENISAIYDGQVYPVEILMPTKAYAPRFFGLQLRQEGMFGYWHLVFGEFDGAESGEQTVTLVWPDGTSDTIYHKRVVATPLAISDRWKLNGEKGSNPVVLVK